MSEQMQRYALKYAGMGFNVIPWRCKGGSPSNKAPYLKGWTEQRQEAPSPDEIRAWFTRWPAANVGIVTGLQPNDLNLVLWDIDTKNGKQGRESHAYCVEKFGFPRTYGNTSCSGGDHRLLAFPANVTVPNQTNLTIPGIEGESGIDIRGTGGFVAMPPSIVKGKPYKAHDKLTVKSIAKAPGWLVQLLTRDQVAPAQRQKVEYTGAGVGDVRRWLSRIQKHTPRPCYEDWFKLIFATLDALGGDIETTNALLCEYLPEEREGEYMDKLTNTTADNIGAGSLVNYAEYGQFQKPQILGTPGDGQQGEPPEPGSFPDTESTLTDESGAGDAHYAIQTENGLTYIPKPGPDDFYFYDQKKPGGPVVLRIDNDKLVSRMSELGFRKAYIGGINTSTLIHANGQILQEVSAELIKDAITSDIDTKDNRSELRNRLIKGSNVYFGRPALEWLPKLKPDFKRSTKDEVFFYFKNGPVRVTADNIELLSYDDLDGHIWKDQIIDRVFNIEPNKQKLWGSEFMRFMRRTMRCENKQTPRLDALMSACGYLLSDHKDPAQAKAIVFVDEVISDVASGRAGKSLTAKALGHMQPVNHIDSRNFRFDHTFAFQSVSPADRVVHFNDCSENFQFDKLFSMITDVLQIERKNQPQITLPFDQSPKFLLSTNYVIAGKGGSHQDRIFEIEFSDYFNKDYKPTDEFGHRLFDDWSADEWSLFDNVMLSCVKRFLKKGLSSYAHINLLFKQIIQATSPEFYEYTKVFAPKPRKCIYIKESRDKFLQEEDIPNSWQGFPHLAESVSSQQFRKWLEIYAELHGWSVKKERNANGWYLIFSNPVKNTHDKT